MQPIDKLSVSRRSLDVEDYIDLVRRHKAWILGPFLLALVASVIGAYLWPESFVSTAAIKIVPQQVPQNMVQSVINQEMTDRLNSMAQTIESRTELTNIINTFGLYPRERKLTTDEDVIDEMRKNIHIDPVSSVTGPGGDRRQLPAFAISFSYSNRYLAQKVVQDLVSRFVNEYNRNSSNQTFQTKQFFQDQAEQAKKELDEIEGKLSTFRVQNNGRLPDQVESNLRQLQSLQASQSALAANVSRATQDKLQLEGQFQIGKEQLSLMVREPAQASTVQTANDKLAEADREIDTWQKTLAALRQQYREGFPDVQAAVGRLEAAKKKRDEVLKQGSAPKPADAPETPVVAAISVNPQAMQAARSMQASLEQIQNLIASKNLEIENANKELKRTTDMVRSYQSRVDSSPLGQKDYEELKRQQEMARAKYLDLDQRLAKAAISGEMEGRKQGETIAQLDPASLPETPTEPKRPAVISIGAAVGLLLGIVLAGAREVKDSSLKNLKDVRAYTQMAVLGNIPLLENDYVMRRRKRLNWLGWTTACLVSAFLMGGTIAYHYMSSN